MRIGEASPSIARASAAAAAIAFTACGMLAMTRSLYRTLNADTLYPWVFVRDVFAGGNPRAWNVTPAPSYVDLAALLGIRLASQTPTVTEAYTLYATCVCAVLLVLCMAAQRASSAGSWRHAWLGAVGTAAVYARAPGGVELHGPLVVPTAHVVPLLLVVATTILLARPPVAARARRRLVLGAAVIGLLAAGDPLFLVQGLLPLATVAAIAVVWRRLFARALRRALLTVTAVESVAYVVTSSLIAALGPSVPAAPEAHVGIDSWKAGLLNLARYLVGVLPNDVNPIGAVFLALWWAFTIAFVVVTLVRRRGRPLDTQVAIAAFIIASAVYSVVVPIVRGMWVEWPVIRYALPTFLLPFLLPWIGVAARSTVRRLVLAGTLSITAFACAHPLSDLSAPLERQYAVDRAVTGALENLARDGVRVGLAPYWTTKQVMVDVDPDIHITSISASGVASPWLANREWLFERSAHGLAYPDAFFLLDDDIVTVEAPFLTKPRREWHVGTNRIRVFAATKESFGPLVRDVCLHTVTSAGVDCAPVRGAIDLLPVLLERDVAPLGLVGLDLPLVGGTYRVEVDAPGIEGLRAELCACTQGCVEHAMISGQATFARVARCLDGARLRLRWARGSADSIRSVFMMREDVRR